MKPFIQLLSQITITSFLILIGAVNLIAQQKDLHQSSNEIREIAMQHLSATEGLSQGMINDMVVDQLGYLYVATKEGLNRFDGNNFKVYRHTPKYPKSIADNFVSALYVDEKNRIWSGTYNSGLDCFDTSTETFTHISLNELNEKGSGLHNIASIQSVGKGRIMVWIGENLKIIELNTSKKGIHLREIEDLYPGLNSAFQGNFKNKNIICQSNGLIWIKSGKNIFRYSTKGLEPILVDIPLQTDFLTTERLWENPHTKQMFLVLENSILQFDNTTNKFLPWLVLPAPYSFSNLVFADREGNIWSSFENKYYLRINPKTASFELVEPKSIGLNDGTIMLKAKVDNQGNIWLGSNGWGLFKISPTYIYFKKIKSYPTKNFYYAWPFRISKKGLNAVYAPTLIADWANKIEQTELYKKGFRNSEYKEHFAEDGNGNYWFAMSNILNKNTVIFKMDAFSGAYSIMKEKKSTVSDNGFRDFQPIFSDKKKRIWAAEHSRLDTAKIYLFEQGGKTTKEFILPILQKWPSEQRTVSDWVEDQDGTIWMATTMGLFALLPETGQWKIYGEGGVKNKSLSLNKLLSVCLDPNQPQKYIWIGTEGGGLNRLDKTTGIITIYTIKNGLPNNVIYSIQSDIHKNLWLSTNNGLCLFNPNTLICRNFDKSHGLEGNEFNRYQFSKSNTGEIYLGGVGFNIHFNPEDFYTLSPSAKIVINGLKVLNKEIGIDNQDAQKKPIISKAIEYTQKITLHHNQSMVSFNFALLDLKNPASNYYRYKLVGLYNDWVDNGKKSEAIFTNIEPGSYTFIVSGHNGDGVWSKPAQIELVIEPAWWQTWWFKAILFIIFIALLYIFFQYRVSKAVELEKLRNRIAQDLHDEIGSTLSSVSIYSSALSKSFKNLPKNQSEIIDKISDSTINMMATMNDIVWSINPANDSFENLINRMRAYASSVTEATDIKLHFENTLDNDKIRITMLQRKNLYLIFKEAVNNSLKHSDCTHLSIKLSMTNKKLELLVTDNGKGMVADNNFETKMGGNGIGNMYSRAKESNGSISIVSRPKEGTSIQFCMNV
jgi:ligand-binding sensor domain-containing protein/two-component sensor histidine kinase